MFIFNLKAPDSAEEQFFQQCPLHALCVTKMETVLENSIESKKYLCESSTCKTLSQCERTYRNSDKWNVTTFVWNIIDPSMVFKLTFDKDQLANIHQHYWKERLKVSKLVKYKSDMSQASEDTALQSCEHLQTSRWWAQLPLPPPPPPSPPYKRV